MTITKFVLTTLVSILLVVPVACHKNPAPASPGAPQEGQEAEVLVGLASYSAIDVPPEELNQLTAAHRTLPLGTRLLVTNLENNRSVTVTVTQRGPAQKDQILQLSYGAARELSMLGTGVVKVRIEVLHE